MDDLTEGITYDFDSLANYFYVSSWSNNELENIPLWYMYTNEMKGVRVEADSNFLELEESTPDCRVLNIVKDDVIAYRLMYDNDDSFLCDVLYTDEQETCLPHPRGYISPNILNVGSTKPRAWAFQSEVRFKLYGISKNDIAKYGDNLNQRVWNAMYAHKNNSCEYIDLKFDLTRLNNANFLLGPNSAESELIELQNLIKEYLPDHHGEIGKSKLLIRYKQK